MRVCSKFWKRYEHEFYYMTIVWSVIFLNWIHKGNLNYICFYFTKICTHFAKHWLLNGLKLIYCRQNIRTTLVCLWSKEVNVCDNHANMNYWLNILKSKISLFNICEDIFCLHYNDHFINALCWENRTIYTGIIIQNKLSVKRGWVLLILLVRWSVSLVSGRYYMLCRIN
jgi:hypothetical protein